ncbi:hypothetical protein C8J57DRAFT_1510663 [Mycena rebaudengoi]|nr:hypothetical protein C8J57DRAFT_1510663 [Mycena rebaudengoi]
MSAPTQELPPWLTYTTIILPETTMTSVLYLPLTYYGPSIPLGTDWVYGGLTSPATTATTPSETPASSSTTSALSSSSSPSSALPTSSSSLSSSPSSSESSAAPSGTALPATRASSSLSRGQIIGIAIAGHSFGAVLDGSRGSESGSSSRRYRDIFTAPFTRRPRARTRFTMLTPGTGSVDSLDAAEYEVVPRSPDAVPTMRGGEADPFLTRLPGPHPAAVAAAATERRGQRGEQQLQQQQLAHNNEQRHQRLGVRRPPRASLTLCSLVSQQQRQLRRSWWKWPAGRRSADPLACADGHPRGGGRGAQRSSQRASSQLPSPPHSPKSSLDVEGDAQVLVATRVPISPRSSSGLSPLADVSGVSPLSALAAGYKPDEKAEKRKSWLPRFSWLMPSSSSRRGSRDLEAAEGERELLFDAGPSSAGHSPHASMSMPAPPRLVPASRGPGKA